jgi:hypothetical protein
MLSSLGVLSNNNIPSGFSLAPIAESSTPTSETTISSSDLVLQSCGHWCSGSFLRFLLVLSCCLLACIYPIAMRFYLVYFSVLVPLIFAVLNYSLGQLTPTQTSTNAATAAVNTITTHIPPMEQPIHLENRNMTLPPFRISADVGNSSKFLPRNSSLKRKHSQSPEQFELQSPLMSNIVQDNDGIDEREEFLITPSSSSQSSAIQIHTDTQHHHRPPISGKQKYFSNTLYEKCSRNMLIR